MLRENPSPAGDLDQCLRRVRRGTALQRTLLMGHDDAASDLTKPLLDAVSLFDALRIRYALVDGLAAMYYGRARFTEDVDFIAQSGHEQVLAAHADVMRQLHFDPGCTWKLYHQNGEIDIWKDAAVDEMLNRAKPVMLAGRQVMMIEVHDLVAMKLRARRPQDDYDIAEILPRQPLDDALVRRRTDDEAYAHYQQLKRRIGQ